MQRQTWVAASSPALMANRWPCWLLIGAPSCTALAPRVSILPTSTPFMVEHCVLVQGEGHSAAADLGGSIITGIDGNSLAVLAAQQGIPMHSIGTEIEHIASCHIDHHSTISRVRRMGVTVLQQTWAAASSLALMATHWPCWLLSRAFPCTASVSIWLHSTVIISRQLLACAG